MKKQYFFIGVILILVGTLTTLAAYKYYKDPSNVTVGQAVRQRDDALVNLKIQQALNENDKQAVTNLSADKLQLTETKATLCAQIKAAKLIQPLCE